MTAIIDNEMLWRQFSTAIDALESALRDCPDELWEQPLWDDQPDQWVAAGFSTFWYLGYHTLFWLDLYLTGAEEGFNPPAPFDLVEMQDNEVLPRTYSRAELLDYLGCAVSAAKPRSRGCRQSRHSSYAASRGEKCPLASCCSTPCATWWSTPRSCTCSSDSGQGRKARGSSQSSAISVSS